MYNKLKANSDMLLAPAINQLKDMRERNINGNNRINEIDKQIAELAEQNLLITKLKNKGYMDDDDYLEQKSEIDAKLAELRKDRNVLLLDEYDETLDKLINLQKILEDSPAFMKNFMKDIFEELVENITVYDNKLTFRLYSGLELNENIRKEKRNGA